VRKDQHEPKPDERAAVARWRQRMSSPQAQDIYRDRAATAECVSAQAHHRGLIRLPVRGLPKVRRVVLLFALAHNLVRTVALAPQLLGLTRRNPSAAQAFAA